MISSFFKIVVIALSLALDVFAVSVGVGVRDVTTAMKWRIGVAFASAEIVMNLIGAGLGAALGKLIGDTAGYLGFGALVFLGSYMIYESLHKRSERPPLDLSSGWGLFIAALSISLDSLGIGFSILYVGVPIEISLVVIGIVSVTATWLGLALGKRLGSIAEERAELVGGVMLLVTGLAFIAFKALHLG